LKTAIITGVHGQDGSYLAEFLLAEGGYKVVGVARRTSSPADWRVRQLYSNSNFSVVRGDVTDALCIHRIIEREGGETDLLEVYNLAAQSHVGDSFKEPSHTTDVVYKGALNCLEALRNISVSPSTQKRFYQASSSEMFGSAYSARWTPKQGPFQYHSITIHEKIEDMFEEVRYQNEQTPFSPASPYAVAKLAAHHLTRIYREAYGLYACCGILHNHESARRSPEFVTRKITSYIGRLVRQETSEKLKLGNLDAKRDWGHARDYVRGMWLMLQQATPADYVLATGETHSVRDFLAEAFSCVGLRWEDHVEIDKSLFRPSEVPYLRGDASLACEKLGWTPTVSFRELVRQMVEADLRAQS
jgi:GDPmannose 4,6-dehydratase